MPRRNHRADALRRKATSLLRDWGTCPECGDRWTLQISIPPAAGRLVVAITCARNSCELRRDFSSTYLQQLGAIADQTRRRFELGAKVPDFEEEIRKKMGEVLRESQEREEARIFGFSWDDVFGRRG